MKCLLFMLLVFFSDFTSKAQQLVMPGDHPDPSVVKIGDTYWASATTSNWFPAYPLMKSKDLIQWNTVGYVFNQLPAWTDFYFWAPEISYDNGKVYVYYSAHKKNGNLCVGIASADKPEGPYKDHGPLICQEAGSIDAFPMRDENGKLYLIWKEDGNSVGKPTPIWAQELNEERTMLIGQKKELFRNDAQWEGNLVEGVSMIKHGQYYYAFYAAAACCGRACTYGSGVARAKNLLGPWEKYNKNPVIVNSQHWKCPGHGTPVEKDGKYYFLYHAYDTGTHVYTGRQGVLMEFEFTPDEWITFSNKNNTASKGVTSFIKDEFTGNALSRNWQWSVFQDVKYELKNGCLNLMTIPGVKTAYIGQKTYSNKYEAVTELNTKLSNAGGGIGLIGDDGNQVNAIFNNNALQLITLREGKESIMETLSIRPGNKLFLRMNVENGKDISFYYSLTGKDYIKLNAKAVDGSFLPPWDRGLRAGLVATGAAGEKAVFEKFDLQSFD